VRRGVSTLLLAALLGLAPGPGAAQGLQEATVAGTAERFAAATQAWRSAQDLDQLAAAVAQLRAASGLPPAQKAQADRELAAAQGALSAGGGGEARRAFAHAAALLLDEAWDARSEFAASIAIDPAALVIDPQTPVPALVTQRYAATWSGAEPLSLRISVVPSAGDAAVRTLWATQLPARDLAGEPLAVDLDLRGLPGGRYELRAELLDGGQRLREWAVPLALVEQLQRDAAALGARLDALGDHEAVAAAARYPFELARAINGWRRRMPARFDFPAAVERSRALVAALERGEDPLTRATGEQRRAYGAESGEILPFHLYVPERWDGRRALPLLVLLHADGEEGDAFFDGPRREMLLKLAADHQFILVAPSGFRPQAAFGSAPARVLARLGARPGVAPASIGTLAERDVLEVIERVTAEYGAERRRIYLYGSGGGGSGAWHLGSRYGALFAALASCGVTPQVADPATWRNLPGLALIGGLDPELRRQALREAVQALRAARLPVSRLEIGGQSSQEACAAPDARVFQFLRQYQRRLSAADGAGARPAATRAAPPE
jgi:poly(3-hydroxybutyrate) depolymerase